MMSSSDFSPKHHHHHNSRGQRWSCVLICTALLIFLAVLISILAVTVFRMRSARTTVNSVRLTSLRAGFDTADLIVLNVTLDLEVTAINPNHASFKFFNGSAELYYRGTLVGEVAIPPMEVAAEGSVHTDVTLTVLAGRLVANPALYSDVISGIVLFTACTTVPGRINILGIFKHYMVAYTTCDIIVNIHWETVKSSDCKSRVEL